MALPTKAEHMNTQDTTVPLTATLQTQVTCVHRKVCAFATGILVGASNWKQKSLNSRVDKHDAVHANNEMHRPAASCHIQAPR